MCCRRLKQALSAAWRLALWLLYWLLPAAETKRTPEGELWTTQQANVKSGDATGGGGEGPKGRRLTAEQEERLAELERRLEEEPEPFASVHLREDRRRRLLRFLVGSKFKVETCITRLQNHAAWWERFGMDSTTDEDELDETGPLFVCGEDLKGQPVLIARPCVHLPKCKEDSLRAARRTICTMQRCMDRISPDVHPQKITVIYDCRGLRRQNLDMVFSREVIGQGDRNFPERLERLMIINTHWTMNFFWSAVSLLLDPDVKAKIWFCGSDLEKKLTQFVPEDHPYLQYALKVRQTKGHVPLPRSAPYVPRHIGVARQAQKQKYEEEGGGLSSCVSTGTGFGGEGAAATRRGLPPRQALSSADSLPSRKSSGSRLAGSLGTASCFSFMLGRGTPTKKGGNAGRTGPR